MYAQVKEAWAVVAAREGWEKLPKYALGVSSGASMVHSCSLPLVIGIRAVECLAATHLPLVTMLTLQS